MENNSTLENTTPIPVLLQQIIETISKLYPNISKEIITNVLLVKCFQMFTIKRITLDESGRIKIPNWFALILLQSGGGKDRLVNDIDEFVFKDYHKWFEEKVNSIYEQQEQQINNEQGENKNDKTEENPF